MGYMYMKDKTTETIDSEGWLHSGDVAKFDDDNDPNIPAPSGFMSITGRIKELIITAGGENIPPVLIENEVSSEGRVRVLGFGFVCARREDEGGCEESCEYPETPV